METISITKLNQLHPNLREPALIAYNRAVMRTPVGVHPYITQTLRTFQESDILYQQGRTTPGAIVTQAQAGQSYHNYGLALDFVMLIGGKAVWVVDENWMIVVEEFKKQGFTWGGDFKKFKDRPHLENKLGYHWRDLLKKHDSGDFIKYTNYVNL